MLLNQITDDEIFKYYSILTPEGRKMLRQICYLVSDVAEIDEHTDENRIKELYNKLRALIPENVLLQIDKCYTESGKNAEELLQTLDMTENSIVAGALKIYKIREKRNLSDIE